MKTSLIKSIFVFGLCLWSVSAHAQSCNITSLGNCLFNSGVSCRATVANCSADRSAGLSIPDVENQVTASCCRFTGKNKKIKANLCFKRVELDLAVSSLPTSPLKKFIKQSQRAVAALRKAGCSTGSTN